MTMQPLFRIPSRHNARVEAALAVGDVSGLSNLWAPVDRKFDAVVATALLSHALAKFPLDTDKGNSELDRWLAPRVHCLLRIPRSLAADCGLWTWLAVGVFKPYIERRWPKKPDSNWWRYDARDVLRNGVARLWWAAELVRSGPDYSLVGDVLAAVRVFQNVGELRYSWHRETARAFTRVLRDRQDIGDALSPVFNAHLATQALERFDLSEPPEEAGLWDAEWGQKSPSLKQLMLPDGELVGPSTGVSRQSVENEAYDWLSSVFESIS